MQVLSQLYQERHALLILVMESARSVMPRYVFSRSESEPFFVLPVSKQQRAYNTYIHVRDIR